MINNQWYVILESSEVKMGKIVSVMRLEKKLIAWRDEEQKVHVMEDRCPHMGAALSQAKLHEGHIACAFHGLEFDGLGICKYVPALGRHGKIPRALHVISYRVHEQAGFIWLWLTNDDALPENPPLFFEAITDDFSYISFQQQWDIHYSRMAENQLDVMHLPFVHATTIGRSGKTVVDGPIVVADDDMIQVWVMNRLDDGVPAKRASDITPPDRHPALQFLFPNLWHNWISDDVRVLAAFVPIDNEHSIFYGRFYQRINKMPLVKQIINWWGKIGSLVIAGQDQRVVTHITPKASSLKDGDILLQGDRAVVTYRQMRAKKQEQ
ncbi:MAG: aromatic ring-hydroxylating dioxygenase subunit alpha [Anaerolineaceae bacterium]|nr:aromatic ring-hydroxylating dioxygenase subunit alpha [Anaerolineaceae bacterium]